ncbi:MAG: hypothetical protein DWQ08_08425 [Proteobacteria bacterium]|nr:MAG: hypothetical protein DWQ08_08425 [Pseudomonadota bacterium]
MIEPRIAVVTPSYAPDLARCRLLTESLQRHARFDYRHYIIVAPPDLHLFRPLAADRVEVVPTDALLPGWLAPPAAHPGAWTGKDGRHIPGWIVQQLSKLAFARQAVEDVLVLVDSDICFVRAFDRDVFCREGRVRLFRVPDFHLVEFEPWYEVADYVLGLRGYVKGLPQPNYVGPLAVWVRDHAVALCRHIEDTMGEPWLDCLSRIEQFSEYTIYGVFVDQILNGSNRHIRDMRGLCHSYWPSETPDDRQLHAFLDKIDPRQIALMVTARAGVDPDRYRHVVDSIDDPL